MLVQTAGSLTVRQFCFARLPAKRSAQVDDPAAALV